MSALTAALLADLTEKDLDQLAERLAPRLAAGQQHEPSGYLDVARAAEFLACPHSRIYALVSARRIPFHRDSSRLLFRREELDAWVHAGGARRP